MTTTNTATIPVPCPFAIGMLNQIEARDMPFQLVVPAGHKSAARFIQFELWEDGNPLPHTIRLNDDGTWRMTTEIKV